MKDSKFVRRGFFVVALCQLALLAVLVPHNQKQFNVDPICYIRTAQYYHSGDWELAVSSYWSPMVSWILIPFLSLIDDPLAASSPVNAISAIVFLWGAAALITATGLARAYGYGAALVCAVAGAVWAAGPLTADLPVAGLCAFAMAMLIAPRWATTLRAPVLVGALFGVAYLTKSIALPWSFLLCAAMALMHVLGGVTWSAAFRSYLITQSVAVAIATPWIILISLNVGSFTIGTSSLSAHALAAPELFNKESIANNTIDPFRKPEPGRLSPWEDPHPDGFVRWNPLANIQNLKHQFYVIVRNFFTVTNLISELDVLHLGLAASVLAFLVHGPWRANMVGQKWRWSLIPVVTLSALYLPLFASSNRYFYPIFPWLVIATIGLAEVLASRVGGNSRVISRLALLLVVGSFLFPYIWRLGSLVPGNVDNVTVPADLARRLRQAGFDGPVAASKNDPAEGIYVAYFLEQPTYEFDLENGELRQIILSGAKSFVVLRRSRAFDQLACNPCFESLDGRLYASADEALQCPIAAFAIQSDCELSSN